MPLFHNHHTGKAKLIAGGKEVPKLGGDLPGDVIGMIDANDAEHNTVGEGDSGRGSDYYVVSYDPRLIHGKQCLPDYIREQFPVYVTHRGAVLDTTVDLVTSLAGSGVSLKTTAESLTEVQALRTFRAAKNYYNTAAHLNSRPASEY